MADWMYKYSDGTMGASPWQRDASGNVMLDANGSVMEGSFLGSANPGGGYTPGVSGSAAASMMGYTPPDFVDPATVRPSGGATFGGSSSGSGGVYNGNTKTSGGGFGGQNPYLQPMMDSITNQVTTNFNRNVMPQISSQMMATGGYGGSRQGVIEANAMRDMNQGLANSLASLGLQDFNAMRGYDLGLRGNDLGFAGLDAQIAQNNFNNNLTGAQFGLSIFDRLMGNNQTGINAGTNVQNTPMNYWSQFGNQFNSIGQGYGATTGSTSQQGNPFMSALGGAQLGSRIGSMWGGQGPTTNSVGGANAQGWGTGAGYGNQDLGLNF
ncbi:hypothetical protein [Acidovorax sp.]|uniref:hypothetical protein n=1 Tax=Acidovorax sp. TaxID=1872122 RepID=UPI00391B59F4